MLASQKIDLRRSSIRSRLAEITSLEGDAYTAEIKGEEKTLHAEIGGLETRYKSALLSETDELAELEKRTANAPDAETRERIELRSKAQLTNFFQARAQGKMLTGPEAELSAAAGVDGGIPIELFDVPEQRGEQVFVNVMTETGIERRAVTPAPGTVGVNLDPIRPAVFANSIASRLGVDMPRVSTGTYASGTITGSQDAAAKAKGDDAVAGTGAITVQTAVPKRISARLELALEDIAAIGQANFESILRQNLSLVLSDELDKQMISGDGQAPNLSGMILRLEAINNPTDPTEIVDFDNLVFAFTDAVDGLWSTTPKEVGIVAGVDTFKLAAKSFRDIAAADLGAIAFTDYAAMHYGGFWTNKRMPAPDGNIQRAIVYRKGRSMMGGSGGMRTSVCPHWGSISIDDIFTGSASGTRAFTMHVLVGDIILVQPDAYALREFKVS